MSLSEEVEVRDMVRAWLSDVTLDMVCAAVIVVDVLALVLVVRLGKLCAWLNKLPETVKYTKVYIYVMVKQLTEQLSYFVLLGTWNDKRDSFNFIMM